MTSSPTRSTRSAPVSEVQVPERIPWSVLGPEFIAAWGRPRGKVMPEHLEVLGQSGSGKSFFLACILLQRQLARGSHIIIVATKADDDTLMGIGWPVVDTYPPPEGEPCIVFWPPAAGLTIAGKKQQAQKIQKLLEKLWHKNSNVIIVFDEIAYLCTELNFPPDTPMKVILATYLREGRALGITCVSATQRPQGVIRQVHSEAGWTVCFAPKDEEDAERMAQVLGSKKLYMPILMSLDREKYEFLIVHGLTGKMYISWIDHPLPEPPKKNRR